MKFSEYVIYLLGFATEFFHMILIVIILTVVLQSVAERNKFPKFGIFF